MIIQKQLTVLRGNEIEFWCIINDNVNNRLKLVFELGNFNLEMLYKMTLQLKRNVSKNGISTIINNNTFYGDLCPRIRLNYSYVKSMYRRYPKLPTFNLLFNDHYSNSHWRMSQMYYIVPINELNLNHENPVIKKYDGLIFVDSWGPSMIKWFSYFKLDNLLMNNGKSIDESV